LEYFDGNKWNKDLKKLKLLCKKDDEKKDKDLFKSLDNPNEYIENLLK